MESLSGGTDAATKFAALKQITATLLEPDGHAPNVQGATDALYRFFLEISGLDAGRTIQSNDTILANGKAIGPFWAAYCIKDVYRTQKFLRGTYAAIKSMRLKRPGTAVHVLYAGTGPFATLALPLTTVFEPEEVQFTFLEINPESIQILRKVIDTLGVGAYVRALEQCDACTYQSSADLPIQIIVVEAMQQALQEEPQVAITTNLAPQLAPGGHFIPQCISVHAGLLHPRKNTERMLSLDHIVTDHFILLDKVFELNALKPKPAFGFSVDASAVQVFPDIRVDIPQKRPPGYKKLCLFTDIQVFESERIAFWESPLSHPVLVMNIDEEHRPVKQVSFKYSLGEKPGFSCTVLEIG